MMAADTPDQDLPSVLPVAVPLPWSNASDSSRSDDTLTPLGATTTESSALSVGSARSGRRALGLVRDSLSARDWQVLRLVASHRYLSTRQLEGFCFFDHATPLTAARVCRRVLRRLDDLRILRHLERRIGGVRAGSASYIWQLGPLGDRLLREATDVRVRPHEPSRLFLDHCLAVADAHLALAAAARGGDLELVSLQTEPECWRSYTGLAGARLVLQPDLYVVTGDPTDRDFVNCWFIEIDRGTENPKRLLAKSARYEDYRRTGREQADGASFPLVVWVMCDQRHVERLIRAIRDSGLDERLYRITTADGFIELVRGGAQ